VERYAPTYHTIVAIDVAGSGCLDDRLQLRMRADLRSLIADTLALQSLEAAAVHRIDLGDGVRLIFPATVSPCSLLDPFVPNLASGLRSERLAADSIRLRLRVAVHAGLLHRDSGGWAGAPLVHCARLLDAGPVRRALRVAHRANLVLVVSQGMYDSVVRHGYGLDRSTYRPVKIRVKETNATAWVHLAGEASPSYMAHDDPSSRSANAAHGQPQRADMATHSSLSSTRLGMGQGRLVCGDGAGKAVAAGSPYRTFGVNGEAGRRSGWSLLQGQLRTRLGLSLSLVSLLSNLPFPLNVGGLRTCSVCLDPGDDP
jgi:hypothetical protein